MHLWLTAAAVLVIAPPPLSPAHAQEVGAGTLADGRYICQIWIGSMLSTLGKVDIKGRTYRGPSHTPAGPFKPFAVKNDEISWPLNFSQIAAAGGRITGARVSKGGRSFVVSYVTKSGFKEGMECARE